MEKMQRIGERAEGPLIIAKTVFKAANDGSRRLRYPAGGGAPLLLFIRRTVPDRIRFAIIRNLTGK